MARMPKDAIERRMDELIEQELEKYGPLKVTTKMDTVDAALRREFRLGEDRVRWCEVVVRIAKRVGIWKTILAEPKAVSAARKRRPYPPRWEMLSAMVYGDAESWENVRALYERENGPGSASKSWTGRGTKTGSRS
jgi:hypothetical protein